ncbi:MAG: hypothetical protein JNK04_15980 [Myxococcales bacterium]|nr:hypothetical protein [Myxococcales bacterium]
MITRALAKDASDRYPTIRAFAAALTPFASGADTSHWSRPPPPPPPDSFDGGGSKPNLETATTLHVQTGNQPKSGRALWVGGGALTVLVLGGALAFAAARSSGSAPAVSSERVDAPPSAKQADTSVVATASAAVQSPPGVAPTGTSSTSATSSSVPVEKPIRTGAKPPPSATEKPAVKPPPTGGSLPTRL